MGCRYNGLGNAFTFIDHAAEFLDSRQRVGETVHGIDEGNKLGAAERRVLGRVILVELEQDLESSAVAIGLQLSPEAALIAANTVHDPADVPEAIAEVFFQDNSIGVLEHDCFVEDLRARGKSRSQAQDRVLCTQILFGVFRAERIVLDMLLDLAYCTHNERIVEVDVGDAFRIVVESLLVAGKIRAPLTSRLVQVVPAQMRRDRCVHARNNAMEYALLQTGVVELDRIQAFYRRSVRDRGLDLLLNTPSFMTFRSWFAANICC